MVASASSGRSTESGRNSEMTNVVGFKVCLIAMAELAELQGKD